jgi:cytochrome b pre-mRNA-processing protein 3
VIARVAGLFGRSGYRTSARHDRAGLALYRAAVAAARDPWFYRALRVSDTLDGRFDLIAVHTFLLIHRLQDAPAPGPVLAQAVFDAMFRDMDDNLREIGVGDLSVSRRMRAMWEALHGRAQAYGSALRAANSQDLAAALARNVWRSAAPEGSPASLAKMVLAQAAYLGSQPLGALAAGDVRFLSPWEAMR